MGGQAKFFASSWVKTQSVDFKNTVAANVNLQQSISIHDLDMSFGQVLNIVSPYYTNDLPSNSLMHPTVIRTSKGVDGSPYLMAVTPFANANDQTENVCTYVSDDLLTWRSPSGVTNPVFGTPATGYNSDTALYEHTDGYFYLIWRRRVNGGDNYIYGSRSLDGIVWEAPTTLFQAVQTTIDWASPSFYHDGTQWVLFAHDIVNVPSPNRLIKYTKSGDLLASWNALSPTVVSPTHPNSLTWWHSDIRRLPNGRLIALALENGQGIGPGGASAAWLWQSDNSGASWTVRQITRGKVNYRSSLVLDGAQVNIILVWVDSDAASGNPTYTTMHLHRMLPGRIDRRRVKADVQAAVNPSYALNLEDEANLIVHADGFTGAAADLTTPWSQVTATAMRRNGSGVTTAANTTNPAFAVVDAGHADHWARVKFSSYVSNTAELIIKGIDASNYVAIGVVDASNKLSIKGYVAGSATLNEMILLTPSIANGMVVRAAADGLMLRVWVDGVLAWERPSIPPELFAGTKVGLRTSGTTSNAFDEFACGRL